MKSILTNQRKRQISWKNSVFVDSGFVKTCDELVIGQNEREEIDNETRCKIALSTIAVALNNTNCSVPCFVQVMDRYKDIFNGFSVGGGLRTNYEMIVLKVRKFQRGNVVSSNQTIIFPNFFPSIIKVVKNEGTLMC